jgi:hypothetical protein
MNSARQRSNSDKLNSNHNQLYSIVKYLYLISLRLDAAHIHYVDQFLSETKTHLPRLSKLIVDYNCLRIVTSNFSRDRTRLNCIKLQ